MAEEKSLNLYQKINKIMTKIDSIEKGGKVKINDRSSYTVVTHDDVTALLHKPLVDVGIMVVPRIETAELIINEKEKIYNNEKSIVLEYVAKVWCSLEFINVDKPEEKIRCTSFAYAIDSSDKAVGKAYSMAIKYIYLKTFMLESYDDEESRDYENKNYVNKGAAKENNSSSSLAQGSNQAGKPTPNQINYIKDLVIKKNYKEPVDYSKLTFDGAKELINTLSAIKV